MKKPHLKSSTTTGHRSPGVIKRINRRQHLAKATENYFKSLSAEAAAEENAIARSLTSSAVDMDFSKDF